MQLQMRYFVILRHPYLRSMSKSSNGELVWVLLPHTGLSESVKKYELNSSAPLRF